MKKDLSDKRYHEVIAFMEKVRPGRETIFSPNPGEEMLKSNPLKNEKEKKKMRKRTKFFYKFPMFFLYLQS